MKISKTLKALAFAILTTGILAASITLIPEKTLAQTPSSKLKKSSTQTNGRFVRSIHSLPEEAILAAMAVQEADGKGPIDWDAAISLTDELIQLSDRRRNPAGSMPLGNQVNRGGDIRRDVVFGSWVRTKERLAKGRCFSSEIAKQRSAFKTRLKALEKKHGQEVD